jgi:hypothetical protein
MGKFFAQPYSDRKPPLLYTLGYRGYDLEVARKPAFSRWGFFLCTPNCRPCVAAKFLAMVQTRQFSKLSDEWTRS